MKSPLGEFLRARRQVTTIEQVGLVGSRDRRTPGLRREEVAVLAGVSVDYYTRLEQGRDHHPSGQVLDALARVFQLGPEATEHLHELAHPRSSRRGRFGDGYQVCPSVLRLVEGCDHVVAFLINHRMDVLVRNPLALAHFDGLDHNDNVLRMVFLDPAAREFYVDWEREARAFVAHLRAVVEGSGRDPFACELVKDLSRESDDFRRFWAMHEVQLRAHMTIRYRNPDVGELTLHYETLPVSSSPGRYIVIGQAEPGSASEQALTRLAGTRHQTSGVGTCSPGRG
ncbi:helix-turn-helix transcriptional regulator [Sphaerisporangium sp. TRM90804]|uniref:helix-turn-helix transcriptional regulator n=1 Tax=Sphaerisporangium sp. TRM90804 TaxID=3031113 RepID=UPI002449B4D6|nr:helix-turn-helix transcriptional regulator [Sphaerisporangium sp. TRM90804]MDH2426508.1 helix-turn-helix transcriptional regulator [Sphaerisporangium sp. TRM90804]